jgi:7-keto-8-aminopelargonate synthetase-like enzyme
MLLFNSGFDANIALFTCPGRVIMHDEYIHASAIDGISASQVQDDQFSCWPCDSRFPN